MGTEMLALMRRDCVWFLLITAGFLSSTVFFTLGSTDDTPPDGSRIFYLVGVLMICLPSFSLLTSELKESYRFLQILPVTAKEIVASRFLLLFAQVALFWLLVVVVLNSAGLSMADSGAGFGFFNLCTLLALLLTAIWYLGIFRVGFAISTRIMSAVYFVIIVTIIILAESFEGKTSEGFTGSFSPAEWALLILFTLTVYYLLMRIAIRTKIAGRIDQ
jgi:hypothetical protein